MTLRRVRLRPETGAAALTAAFAKIRAENEVPDEFPPEVLAEAQEAARSTTPPERDETGVEFITIDPPGSKDLDQALAIDADGSGYRVRYAIADVPAFVAPGGAVDLEARRRVQTLYLPDGRSPLHPAVLSEGAASLLPDSERSAYVWDLRLDADAVVAETQVYRARVRSRAQLDYASVQADLDAGRAPRVIELLAQVGPRRIDLELARGGASLPMPEQEVHVEGSGPDAVYRLRYRPPAPVEDYNAQISLLTGMAAADLMLQGGVGILRTMPPPDEKAVSRFRRVVAAHGLSWPQEQSYGAFLRGLDRTDPVHLAIIHEATGLFRGAGYTPFDGTRPEQVEHAAVAAAYAHVTAPLRRLVDRFGLAACAALSAGEEVPDWVRAALPELPEIMRAGDRRASAIERACTDAVEAAELHDQVGQEFAAVVVDDRGEKGYVVALIDPAIVAPCRRPEGAAAPAAGDAVRVRLLEADIEARRVSFEIAGR
ncbi:RNB domain-containing ribonuclease [Piscicoccus intestinalis]|uniref:RNB domain-containing ribonuclease n=1 Tax=Piscicoccus intestinalis TaxID=746033 RepID=UPI0008389818|nr:RNB domain-containing ribonuclease [Piscicoccus intestinalis]